MTDRTIGYITLLFFLLALLWALTAPCYDCGGSCVNDYDCMSGCSCMFPENDDNHHYGRCV